jgi:DNA-binding transcriptional LysR family regulator
MDLRDLRYFETIARLEHIGQAAAKLHRTQPALTSSIRRLEQACGAPLFERVGRGIRLTPAGKILLKWAQRLRFDVEDAKREMSALGQGLAGHVRIGIAPTPAQFSLPQVAKQLMSEAPNVTLSTVVGLVDKMKPMLESGELDLMIGTEAPIERGFASQILLEDSIVVATSARHELFNVPKLSMADLTRYRWALQAPGAPTRDWLDKAFEANNLPRPQVQVESSMLIILPNLIAETGLLSFISRYQLSGDFAKLGLREVPVSNAVMHRRLVVTYRTHNALSPAAARVLELFTRLGGDS